MPPAALPKATRLLTTSEETCGPYKPMSLGNNKVLNFTDKVSDKKVGVSENLQGVPTVGVSAAGLQA